MRIPVPLSLFCYKSQSLITAAMPLSTPHQHHLLLSKKTQVCISSSLFWSSISHLELSNSTRKINAFSSAQTRKQRDGKAYGQIRSRMVLSPRLPLFVVFLLPMKDRYGSISLLWHQKMEKYVSCVYCPYTFSLNSLTLYMYTIVEQNKDFYEKICTAMNILPCDCMDISWTFICCKLVCTLTYPNIYDGLNHLKILMTYHQVPLQ